MRNVQVNQSSENIAARRLPTIMERLIEGVSFEGPDLKKKTVVGQSVCGAGW
jgi:ATP-dependent HslUV protease ATP-binding subunit HslU